MDETAIRNRVLTLASVETGDSETVFHFNVRYFDDDDSDNVRTFGTFAVTLKETLIDAEGYIDSSVYLQAASALKNELCEVAALI